MKQKGATWLCTWRYFTYLVRRPKFIAPWIMFNWRRPILTSFINLLKSKEAKWIFYALKCLFKHYPSLNHWATKARLTEAWRYRYTCMAHHCFREWLVICWVPCQYWLGLDPWEQPQLQYIPRQITLILSKSELHFSLLYTCRMAVECYFFPVSLRQTEVVVLHQSPDTRLF